MRKLQEEFGISHVFNDAKDLVILNYDQIESKPKNHPIIIECRGLCLEIGTWKVVAKSFDRFFNLTEVPEINSKFDWANCSTQTKEDGSLLKVYNYNKIWLLQTRGSYAKGAIIQGNQHTWESLFLPLFKNLDKIDTRLTLIAEGCSRLNKIVRDYGENPKVFLLTAFNNETLEEVSIEEADNLAQILELERPSLHKFSSAKQCLDYLDNLKGDPTFEGFVCRDCNNLRLKIKSRIYLELSYLRNNGNLFLTKNILPIILKGEMEEVLSYWKEYRPYFEKIKYIVDELKQRLIFLWNETRQIVNQKEFALAIAKEPAKAILFNARKLNNFELAWNQGHNTIFKEVENVC